MIELHEEAAKTKLGDFVVVPADGKVATKGNIGSASLATRWKYDIIDEGKVPRKYCNPAKSKIQAAVRLGEREIPGVRIYKEEDLTVR